MTRIEYDNLQYKYTMAQTTVTYLAMLHKSLKDLLNPSKASMKFDYSCKKHCNLPPVKVYPEKIETFEINQFGGYGAPEDWVYESFTDGTGWLHKYPIKDLPKIIRHVKKLRKIADRKFTEAQEVFYDAIHQCQKGFENDTASKLRDVLDTYYFVKSEDKQEILNFLEKHNIKL